MEHTLPPPIPPNYEIGKVLEGEDSFFSSIAQCLKQLKGVKTHSKDLWKKCQQYLKEYLEGNDAFDNNNPTTIYGMKLQDYLAHLQKAIKAPPNSVMSRPEQEGRIICNVFNVKIHILHQPDHDNPDGWHTIVNRLGQNRIEDVDYESIDTIHTIRLGDLFFKPILKKSKKELSHNIEKPYAEIKFLQVNEDNDGKIETYEAREGARGAGGHFYEIKLLMLFYLRLQVCDEFYLAANMANVGAFDDAVFKYKVRQKDGSIKTKIVFLQAKHSDKSGVINIDSLMDPKGAFSLKKYFESFQTIKKSFEAGKGQIFKECVDDCRFIIFTNYNLDIKCKKGISNPKRWMYCAVDEIAVGKEHIGKHLNPNEEINQDIIANLSCNPICELAQVTYDYTLGHKKEIGIKVSNELLQKYHTPLANQVFTINEQHPNKSKFSTKFHESESLWKEFCNIAGKSQNEEQFREDLTKVTINLHKNFGKHERQIKDIPILSLPGSDEAVTEGEVKEFLTKLEFVLGQKNENQLDEIIQNEIHKAYKVNDEEEKKAIFGSVKSKVESWWKSGNNFLTKHTKFIENAKTSISNFKLSVFESGLEKRIQKTGVQFNENALDDLKNIVDSHKTLNIVAENGTTLLSVVKLFQTLKTEVGNIRYNFMTVDHVLNIPDYVLRVFQSKEEMPYYLVIESNSEILANVQWAGDENIRSFYIKLFELTEQSSNKHVILITEKSHEHRFDLHQISLDICFSDLTDKSQIQLLDKVVTIQGMRVEIQELIPWNCLEFKDKISTKMIMSLIDDDDIVISNAPQRLCDSEAAFTKYYEKMPLENFLDMITDSQENTVIVISRSRKQTYGLLEELLNFSGVKDVMADHIKKRIDEKTIIIIPLCNPDHILKEFQRICNCKSEKTIYWVEIDSEIVRLQQVYYPDYYLKREFRKNVVLRLEILCQENLKEVLVFNTAEKWKVEEIVNSLQYEYYISHFHANTKNNKAVFAQDSDDAHDKYSDLGQNISVHWLKVGGYCNEQLIWEKLQFGSIDTIRGFIDINKCKRERHSEQQISEVKDKVVVIADEPGMGKTTSLTSVSQQMMTKNWVIRINFLDCEDAIDAIKESELTMEDFYKFVSEVESTGLKNDWAKQLMKHKLHLHEPNTWPILFLFDGFDEISHERRLKILPFLQFIKYKTAARLWVTTRFHTMDILENGLSVFATEFQELSQKNRLDFLNMFWIIRLSPFLKTDNIAQRTEKYSSCLLGKVSDILGAGLSRSLGVPLQLRLLAEALRQHYVEYMNSGDGHIPNFSHVNVLYVYRHFIREKYEIFIRDKNRLNVDESLKLPILRSFDKNHEMLAFDLLLPEDDIIEHKRLSGDEDMLKSVGIIQSIGMEGKPHFIHRTFAEFFVAKVLFRYVGKKESNLTKYARVVKFLNRHIFEESNSVIRNFIHHMSIEPHKDFPIHIATWQNKLKDVVGLIKGTTNCNKCDRFGRTPLHIAAWEGHLNVVKVLLDSGCDAIAQDLLGKTALHYAVMNKQVKVIEHVLNYTADINICNNIFATPLLIEMEIGDSLFRDPEQLKSTLINLTNVNDFDGKTALHYANEMKDWASVMILIIHGANVCSQTGETALEILDHINSTRNVQYDYQFGDSRDYIVGLLMLKFVLPTDRVTAVIRKYLWAGHIKVFHAVRGYLSDLQISGILDRFTTEQGKMGTICDEDHLKFSKYLLQERNDKFMANTLAKDAALFGNLKTMKYVLSQGHKNDYISYMRCAVEGHNLNIVKHLEGNFLYDDDGNTALHLAAYFDSLQIAKYLVENNADVKALNKELQTPLDIASSCRKKIVEPYLRILSNSDYDKPQVKTNSGNQQSTQENVIVSTRYDIKQNASLIPSNQNARSAGITKDELEEYFCKYPLDSDEFGATKLHWAAYIGIIDKDKLFFYIDIDEIDSNGYTPLHYAVTNDQIEMVKVLLSHHAIFNPKSKQGKTPLDIAKGQSVKFLQEINDIFNVFQNSGSNIDSLKSMQLENSDIFIVAINCKDNYSNALLEYAASSNDIDSVLFILRNGAPFTLCPEDQGGPEVRHLFRCLRNIKECIRDNAGQIALPYIECFGKFSGIADVRGYYTQNFVHAIAKTYSVNYYLLNYLVNHGADINAINICYESVISSAINSSNLDLVKFLLYKGVNIEDITPDDKQKLFDCAKEKDRPDITDLLETLLQQSKQTP